MRGALLLVLLFGCASEEPITPTPGVYTTGVEVLQNNCHWVGGVPGTTEVALDGENVTISSASLSLSPITCAPTEVEFSYLCGEWDWSTTDVAWWRRRVMEWTAWDAWTLTDLTEQHGTAGDCVREIVYTGTLQ